MSCLAVSFHGTRPRIEGENTCCLFIIFVSILLWMSCIISTCLTLVIPTDLYMAVYVSKSVKHVLIRCVFILNTRGIPLLKYVCLNYMGLILLSKVSKSILYLLYFQQIQNRLHLFGLSKHLIFSWHTAGWFLLFLVQSFSYRNLWKDHWTSKIV